MKNIKMKVDQIEFNNRGEAVAMIGKVVKRKDINISPFSKKVYFWATLGLDYIGG